MIRCVLACRTIKALRNSDPLNVEHFGCVPSESPANQTAALQAAIDYAFENNIRAIYLPAPGYAIDGSINLTRWHNRGLRIFSLGGHNRGTIIDAQCYGEILFQCQGASGVTFENISVHANHGVDGVNPPDKSKAPAAAFLFSRDSSNGSAGLHRLNGVLVQGCFTEACVLSFSSEVNAYEKCHFDNTCPGRYGVFISESDKDLIRDNGSVGVADLATCRELPNVFVGGNTVHSLRDCVILAGANPTDFRDESRGAALWMTGARSFQISGTLFSGTNLCSARIDGSWGVISGCETEGKGPYGIITSGMSNVSIQGWGGGALYGLNGSRIAGCRFHGSFNPHHGSPYAIDAYEMNGCDIDIQNNAPVRTRWHGDGSRVFPIYPSRSGTSINGAANESRWKFRAGDGVDRFYIEMGNDPRTRLLTNLIQPAMLQRRVQRIDWSPQIAPNTDLGDHIEVIIGGSTLILPPVSVVNPTAPHESFGREMDFFIIQDEVGGHSVRWHGIYRCSAIAGQSPNSITVIRFRETRFGIIQVSPCQVF